MLHRWFLYNVIPILASLTLLSLTDPSSAGNAAPLPAGATNGGVLAADARHSRNGPHRLLPAPWYYRHSPYYPWPGYRGFGNSPYYLPTYPYGFYGSVDPYYGEPPVPDEPGVRPPGSGREQPPRVPPPPLPAPRSLRTATIEVQVPADADVFLEGVKMKTPGTIRRFKTPPLQDGEAYVYEIRATWKENGREISQTQLVDIHAGDRKTILFLSGGVAAGPEK